MKRWIVVVIMVVVLSLSGCGYDKAQNTMVGNSPSFTKIERGEDCDIVYHKETKVMYVVSNRPYNYGSFTLLVNADGSPMLYEE